MTYSIISPLGERKGSGTYDTFYDMDKYKTLDEATEAHDTVILNFVVNEGGVVFFEGYHIKVPDRKLYRQLNHEAKESGLDASDKAMAERLAYNLIKSV